MVRGEEEEGQKVGYDVGEVEGGGGGCGIGLLFVDVGEGS